eukprot:gene22893-29069_t
MDRTVAQRDALRGVGRGARVGHAAVYAQRRRFTGPRQPQLRLRLQQALRGGFHAGVVAQRALLQAVQGVVAVDGPPLRRQARGALLACRRVAVAGVGHILRRAEIGTHGAAACQRQPNGGGQRDLAE